ncbi:MAG: cytochrome c biogenesis protein CcsA [Chlorobi bacterium]|nr:cytochrome c biogenesis protein CcsA [Chlorobiota bacterium]
MGRVTFVMLMIGLGLILYSVVAGLFSPVPDLPVLRQSIRMLYFHVPMWFAMTFLHLIATIYAIQYLRKGDERKASQLPHFLKVALWAGLIGIITGMIWANSTWGTPWHNDPKQNAAAATLLMIAGFFLLWKSLPYSNRYRIASVYVIVSFIMSVALIFVFPRLTDSLHPGAGGNPGFNVYDLDGKMRLVFYPAVIGWLIITYLFAKWDWLISQKIERHGKV